MFYGYCSAYIEAEFRAMSSIELECNEETLKTVMTKAVITSEAVRDAFCVSPYMTSVWHVPGIIYPNIGS